MTKKLYIISATREFLNQINESLDQLGSIEIVGMTEEITRTRQIMSEKIIDILLVNPNGEQTQYDLVEEMSSKYPKTKIIIVEEELKENTLHNALYLGASDVLIKPYDPKKLEESILRVQELEEKKRLAAAERTFSRSKKNKGDIITFFSTKGGVGKTFISTNFAISLAQHTDKRVALVDLDLDYGNSALALDLPPRFTILDVINNTEGIDKDLIESFMLPHGSGLKVLASNVSIEVTDHINESDVRLILESLEESFDYIIVDMPNKFNDHSMPALALADHLILLVTQDLSTIQNIKSLLLSLNELNFPSSKINLILNQYNKKGDINLDDIAQALNREINHTIGIDHKNIITSLNKGEPYLMDYPNNIITKEINDIVASITGEKIKSKNEGANLFTKIKQKLSRKD